MIRTDDGKDIVDELRNIAAGDPAGVMKINQWGEQIKGISRARHSRDPVPPWHGRCRDEGRGHFERSRVAR